MILSTPTSPSSLKGNGSLMFLIFCCLVSALGVFLFGYDLLVISGVKEFIVQHFTFHR